MPLAVPVKVLPGTSEHTDVRVALSHLRDVQIEDLFNREPVQPDWVEQAAQFKDQVVMVLGAGGSVGSQLCRQLAPLQPKKLVLVGRGEHSLVEIRDELQRYCPELPVVLHVADARRQDLPA